MANTTIAIKKSATAASTPGSLEFGELAINYADGKIFYKNVNSSIVEFSPSGGGGGGGNSFGTVNANSTLVVADTAGDILTLLPGTNISIVGDAVNDTITFSANIAPAFDKANSAEVIAIAAFNKANVNVSTTTSTATLAWNSDTFDQYQLTAMAVGVTVSADSGTPVNGQKIIFRFKDNGTARSISLTTGTSKSFRAIGVTLPTTTVISKTLYVGAIYNSTDDRWDVVATAQEA